MKYTESGLGPTITLHWKEIEHAELAARHRNERAMQKGVANAYGLTADDDKNLRLHTQGAAGELAVAKVLGRYWECGESKSDVGGLEVRTMGKAHYGLRVRQADIRADKLCVAVVGQSPTFRIPGWIPARDAERIEWQVDTNDGRPPFYAVPQTELRPIDDLARLLSYEERLTVGTPSPA